MQSKNLITGACLGALLAPSPAYASTIREASERHATRTATQSVPPAAAPLENPHKRIALTLAGIGAGLVVLGVVYQSGVECKDTSTTTNFGVKCGQTANKGLVIAGAVAAAAGGAAYVIGEGKKSSIGVGVGPASIRIHHRLRF